LCRRTSRQLCRRAALRALEMANEVGDYQAGSALERTGQQQSGPVARYFESSFSPNRCFC
jgi:hypothetical protein